ncbi:serine hydrolase domain-containing protein [Microbacteriaceae bacterium 4G12]
MKKRTFIFIFLVLVASSVVLLQWQHGKAKEAKTKKQPSATATAVASDQIPAPKPDNSMLRARLDQFLQERHFNGSALVMQDGEVILDKGYGYADFGKNISNTPDTKYRIGSITKTAVALSILQLQEQGKVNIYDNVNKYIQSFPANKNISLYHLLTHTSGLPSNGTGKVDASNHLKLVTWIGSQNLAFTPGTGWLYSDRNYMVLAYIVEKVSGEPIAKYVKEHIFVPAGMNQSGMGDDPANDANFSKGYVLDNLKEVPAPKLSMQWLYGCGELYTTTHDMYKLDEAIMLGKLISSESMKLMFTPSPNKDYAFSFYILPDYYHNHGVLAGWNTFNNFNWEKRTFVMLFSNVKNGIDDNFNKEFRSMVIPKP